MPEAERQLLVAVLFAALEDVRGERLTGCAKPEDRERIRRQAVAWFRDEDSEHVFSFVAVCEALGLRPREVRRRIGIADDAARAAAV